MRRRPRGAARRLLGIVLAALPGLFACGGDGRTPVLLYSPHGRDLLTLVEETYEALHPEVDVRWLDMGSQDVYDRVRSERANPQGDVWFGGPAEILERAADEDLLQPYRPDWAESVPATSRDPGDLYFGLYRTIPVIVYNRDAVTADEAPRDWDDLLDPRWQGKILIRDPLASGTMRTIFGMILARAVRDTGSAEAGWEWLRRLDAQTKEYVHNPALLHQKMIRQEGVVTMWTLTDILLQREKGAPLAYVFPSSGTPVIDDSIALVAGAPHPAAARAFIDWVGSPEALHLATDEVGFLPARTDLDRATLPDWARDAYDRLVPADVDRRVIDEEGAKWMNRWDREVRGKG